MTLEWGGVLIAVLSFFSGIFVGLGSALRFSDEFEGIESFRAGLKKRRLLLFYLLIPMMIAAVALLYRR